nr:NB-ARC domains-containing protein [Tanacetum cinerariifolium]
MERNITRQLEIPDRVTGWLEEVEKIKEDAERISSNHNGCLSLKMRYQAGRNAFKTTEEIELSIFDLFALNDSNTLEQKLMIDEYA